MWSQTMRQSKPKTVAIRQGNASEMLAYRVGEQNKPDHKNKKTEKRKKTNSKRTTRVMEEGDARRSKRLQEGQHACPRGTDNTCLLQGRNDPKKRKKMPAKGRRAWKTRQQREKQGKTRTKQPIQQASPLPLSRYDSH